MLCLKVLREGSSNRLQVSGATGGAFAAAPTTTAAPGGNWDVAADSGDWAASSAPAGEWGAEAKTSEW